MNILIVNDDGIECEGIQVLANRLAQEHTVCVLAPDVNRSAVSHYITMFNSNTLKQHKGNEWCCSGFPADCTCLGLESDLFGVKFDVVLSGINKGANLGTDIVYSGTCAGARQAVFSGTPGIAVSLDPIDYQKVEEEGWKYNALADFVAKNLDTLISLTNVTSPRMFVNINGASRDSYKGVKIGKSLCRRQYNDTFRVVEEEGKMVSHFYPGRVNAHYEEDSDVKVVEEGYICVNQVYADPVCNEVVDGISFKL